MSFDIQSETVWKRRGDGATAIVVSVARGIVYFRREPGGELYRVALEVFRGAYEVARG